MNDETELYFNGDLIVSGEQEPSNFTLQLKEFAHSLQENREPIASGREVIKVIDTIEAAFKSSTDNSLITIN